MIINYIVLGLYYNTWLLKVRMLFQKEFHSFFCNFNWFMTHNELTRHCCDEVIIWWRIRSRIYKEPRLISRIYIKKVPSLFQTTLVTLLYNQISFWRQWSHHFAHGITKNCRYPETMNSKLASRPFFLSLQTNPL